MRKSKSILGGHKRPKEMGKMITKEIILWLVLSFFLFFIFNTGLRLRTAASFYLSIFFSTVICSVIYYSFITEIMVFFTVSIGSIIAVFFSLREKRDDI